MITSTLFIITLTTYNVLVANAFHIQPSRSTATSLKMSRPKQQHPTLSTPVVPPPPPISMPVWSLSCPIPNTSSSSMSIVTFATPVSVSSPKLWAVSLYKTSRTRCAFLGIKKSGEEYNDVAETSSSVLGGMGPMSSVRRKDALRGEGMLAAGEGAVGWRASQLSGSKNDAARGVGVLQLLTPNQANVVPILGKKTGWDKNYCKMTECSKVLGSDQGRISTPGSNSDEETFEVLPNCASYLQLKLKRVTDGGDHDVAICEVIGTGVWDDKSNLVRWMTESETSCQALDPSTVLYTGKLREDGII